MGKQIELLGSVLTFKRLLFNDLPRDDVDGDFRLGMQCIELAVNYILGGIVRSWEKLLEKCDDHMSILVSIIFDQNLG